VREAFLDPRLAGLWCNVLGLGEPVQQRVVLPGRHLRWGS
jgi:hypothetical protein